MDLLSGPNDTLSLNNHGYFAGLQTKMSNMLSINLLSVCTHIIIKASVVNYCRCVASYTKSSKALTNIFRPEWMQLTTFFVR
jgi:hypothetical protein